MLRECFLLQVAFCFWPFVQTLNFGYVAEKNRVIVVSVASFIWTIILSYLHHTPKDNLPKFLRIQNYEKE